MTYKFRMLCLAGAGGLCCLFLISLSLFSGCGKSDATDVVSRPDIIELNAMARFGPLNRPVVQFAHDKHTEALSKLGKDCTSCHLTTKNGRLSSKYMRLSDDNRKAVMEIYHDNCLACHKEMDTAAAVRPPLTCGECHRDEPVFTASHFPMAFDYSLHYRHVLANNSDCGLCHHIYDETKRELVYVKGKESSCRDCHREDSANGVISYPQAAHIACLGCHRRLYQGPLRCFECHDKEHRLSMVVIKNPPRIERNQPNFVLISAPMSEIAQSKMNTVPFAHDAHETFTNTCRDCHHETLRACKDCHTLGGSTAGGGISLQRAMHEMKSPHSCIGCHDRKKSSEPCSGCHALMEQGRLSEHACPICHAGPEPNKLEETRNRYKSLADFKLPPDKTKLTFAAGDIPDTIAISVLKDKYGPARMPHREIIDTLMAVIRDSRIATHFHGQEDVVCQGCHHHTPIGKRPPLCENCHGKPFDESNLLIPGLYGAYHRQCIGCHDYMGIEMPQGCEGCHAAAGN
jgi:hypothetical protein